MTTHEQFADGLASYALGILSAEESAQLGEHLHGCTECRRELAELRGAIAGMAMSTEEIAPPSRAKERLMRAAFPSALRTGTKSERFAWLTWSFAALALFFFGLSVFLWIQNGRIARQNGALFADALKARARIAKFEAMTRTLEDPRMTQVELQPVGKMREPKARVFHVPRSGKALLIASGLPPTGAGKAYELWVLRKDGRPVPAGVFRPETGRTAIAELAHQSQEEQPSGFAITVEPEGGSEAPTSAPILVGQFGKY